MGIVRGMPGGTGTPIAGAPTAGSPVDTPAPDGPGAEGSLDRGVPEGVAAPGLDSDLLERPKKPIFDDSARVGFLTDPIIVQ